MRRSPTLLASLALLFASACSSPQPTATSEPAAPETAAHTEVEVEATAKESAPEETAEVSSETSPIATLPLRNVETEEDFTLADFSGQTVVVKPMATWCGKCRENLQGVRAAIAEESEAPTIVALSVEANLANEELATYASDEGFDFIFAVASPEMLRELETQFGGSALNPSIGSRFVVRPDGSLSELKTGKVDANVFVEEVRAQARI